MQSETAEKEVIEVAEPEIQSEASAPSREDLRSKGWTATELDSAEKRGMLANAETAAAKKPAAVAFTVDAVKPAEVAEKIEPKASGTLPDFTFKTPEQEKAFLDAFGAGTPQRAMYFRMKNERLARQASDKKAEAAEQRAALLEQRIAALETGKPAQETDELGNPIDPEEKPLTLKQLREMQKVEAEEIAKRQAEQTERAKSLVEAQTTQEEYARAIYPDFDDTVNRAKEVMKNLDTLIPEKWQQAKVVKLIRELQVAAANADKIDLDDYHAAHIAYEIGRLHPDYGKKADASPNGYASEKDGNPKDPKQANGGLTPGQMKRIEENTQRRASSASVPGGGGKRTISIDDVDLPTLNKMSYAERQRFREKHPDQYAKLLRG